MGGFQLHTKLLFAAANFRSMLFQCFVASGCRSRCGRGGSNSIKSTWLPQRGPAILKVRHHIYVVSYQIKLKEVCVWMDEKTKSKALIATKEGSTFHVSFIHYLFIFSNHIKENSSIRLDCVEYHLGNSGRNHRAGGSSHFVSFLRVTLVAHKRNNKITKKQLL